MATIYIVVPCYNERDMLPHSAPVLLDTLGELGKRGLAGPGSRLLLVDDGSNDGTWDVIRGLFDARREVCGLRLDANRGHQNAVMAGLVTAARQGADAAVTIDADLQDDPAAIAVMAERFAAGAQVVCGVRRSRRSDSVFKRVTARGFYILARAGGARTIYDHADFRLLSREAIWRLCRFGTEDLFLRGLVTRLGLPVEKVYYDRTPRTLGESKYTLKKMLHLARRGFESGGLRPAPAPYVEDLHIGLELRQ